MKRYVLADCNNFFVSCERVFNPRLVGKPVVVLSSNDGCVIARSNEAKKLGVPMGAPAFQCKEMFAQYKVIVLSSNFALYSDMSSRVMHVLAEAAQEIEVYSVDEAFLTFPEALAAPDAAYYTEYARTIKHDVYKKVGLPISLGMGPTKTLAKIANYLAKKRGEFGGVFDITDHPEFDAILKSIPVGEVWGIGRRYAKLLQRFGIETVYQLTQCKDDWLRKQMSIIGLKTVMELRGIPCLDLQDQDSQNKSITVSRSFGKSISDLQQLQEAVTCYMSSAAAKLRKQQSVAKMITVFMVSSVRGESYRTYHTTTCMLEIPTAYTPDLLAAAFHCLEKLFKKGTVYKKAGVILQDFYDADCIQTTVVRETPQLEKQAAIMQTLDTINNLLGKNTIFFASAGTERVWQAKTEKKSPAYTTSWHELLTIKI